MYFMFILHMLGIKHDFNNYNKNINYVRNTSIMKPKSNSKHTIRILILYFNRYNQIHR